MKISAEMNVGMDGESVRTEMIKSLILCRCALYRRVDEEKLTRIAEMADAAGISRRFTDDLCGEAARFPERLAGVDAVVGCRRRALTALLNFAGIESSLAFSADEPLDFLKDALGLPNASDKTELDAFAPKTSSEVAAPLEKEKSPQIDLASGWVPWFPVIDAGRCVACKKCVDFCLFGVYAVREKTVRVENPDHCKTDCPACARICPVNAIIFPKSPEDVLNGSLGSAVRPTAEANRSFAERLRQRGKRLPLFKEDEE